MELVTTAIIELISRISHSTRSNRVRPFVEFGNSANDLMRRICSKLSINEPLILNKIQEKRVNKKLISRMATDIFVLFQFGFWHYV
jgi:hypothetical protein